MPIRCLIISIGLILIAIVAEGAPGAPAGAPPPEVPGESGRQAYDDLAALYGEGSLQPDVAGALERLKAADPATRKSAGQYLLALFRQSFADESNNRAAWKALPFFGGGSESAAREFRKRAAEQFAGEDAAGSATHLVTDEALDAAVWLVEGDPLAENQAAGMKVLRRVRSPAAVEAFRKLLSPPHHNAEVVAGLLDEIATRKQADLARVVTPLCGHYRTAIRDAARKAAVVLRLPAPPPFQPAEAFTPWLEGELRDIAAMVLTEIPADAKWRRFAVRAKVPPGEPEQVAEFSGWLLGVTADGYRVLNLFARERTLAKADTKISDRTMKEDADYFLHVRSGADDKGDPFKRMDALSERGGLTGQFQPGFVSLPESLLAAWAFARGDKAAAAAVLFPRLDEAQDERWIRMVARDLLGWHYHDELLHAFCNDRDYAAALTYAAHLSKPTFDGYQYQDRAKELAGQLAARGEDFKTLRLPTPQRWAEMQKTLTRPRQVTYLADRLRLLNCFQWGQPGGVEFDDPQYDRPNRNDAAMEGADGANNKPVEVINPYRELRAMKLEVKDLPPLLPYLADENYIPTYSYWRDFHPGRTMYHVNGMVAPIVNGVAKHDLADLATYRGLDAAGKKQHLERIARWVEANAAKGRTELLLESLQTSKTWNPFQAAAAELIRDKEKRAIPLLAKRLDDFPQQRGEIAELCYRLSPADFLNRARAWVKGADAGDDKELRFWAAMILLHAGDRAKLEGLDDLKRVLEQDDGTVYYPRAFDELLAPGGREEAAKLACGVLPKLRNGLGDFAAAAMVQRLILAGRQEAVDYLSSALDSSAAAGTSSGQYQGKDVQRQQVAGDNAASAVARWRSDKYEYPTLAPDTERAAERTKLKQWLVDQVQLRRDGKKSGLRDDPEPLQPARWQVDAP